MSQAREPGGSSSAANDTICAIATPAGRGGVGVVRLSGPDSIAIARRLCTSLSEPRRAVLRTLRSPDGEIIDQGLVLMFPGPQSFTGEDVVEFQVHGAPVVLESLVAAAVAAGARRAGPGEFTQRAFLNDRMDLAQAEAVADLIDATSVQAARAARRSLSGEFSRRVRELTNDLTRLRVWVEAALDFPDEDVDFLVDGQVAGQVELLRKRLAAIMATADRGRLLNDGVQIAIVGRPNAGKSSLMNALSRRDSAIVTEVPGTTRDVLRETVDIAGVSVTLADTAGLRETEDRVEAEGVRRARAALEHADLVFWVVDVTDSEPPSPPDVPEGVPVIRIDNKTDLADPPAESDGVALSATSGTGLDELERRVTERLDLSPGGEGDFSARQRHLDALARARDDLEEGHAELTATGSGELLAEQLRLAADHLGEITGKMTSDDLLGEIFSSFCIGK